MTLPPLPIHEVPLHYREVKLLAITEGRLLLWLNIAAFVPLVIALLAMDWWWRTARQLRGPFPDPFLSGLSFIGQVIVVAVVIALTFSLHEWIHGLAIRWAGHKPRYGMKLSQGVFYATADDAYFPRNQFVVIALAPLVVLTVGGMAAMLLVSDTLAYYVGLLVVINAAGAIGDLWMSWEALCYPAHALVRDEADRIRIYMPD